MKELIFDVFQLKDLILDLFQSECKLFMTTDSSRLIKQKCNNKCLSPDERQQLNREVRYVFTRLIKTMKEACPSLTAEDITFCCLAKLGLDNLLISHCMGDVNKQPVNQRKYRIKKKMEESNCIFLFELIFST